MLLTTLTVFSIVLHDENKKLTSLDALTDALIRRFTTANNNNNNSNDKTMLDLCDIGCLLRGDTAADVAPSSPHLPVVSCIEWRLLQTLAICNINLVSLSPLADVLLCCKSLDSLSLSHNKLTQLENNLIAALW